MSSPSRFGELRQEVESGKHFLICFSVARKIINIRKLKGIFLASKDYITIVIFFLINLKPFSIANGYHLHLIRRAKDLLVPL